ncbi:MAG: hypothetical protein KA998_03110 [Rickettsiaceae bacterium]|nr:hypothetical protein [Rickettsiaceae bacterium]
MPGNELGILRYLNRSPYFKLSAMSESSDQILSLLRMAHGRTSGSLLHRAASLSQEDMVEELLQEGANPNVYNNLDYLPIECSSNGKITGLLVEYGSIVRDEYIHKVLMAAPYYSAEKLQEILETLGGEKVTAHINQELDNDMPITPLTKVAFGEGRDPVKVELLLNAGAKIPETAVGEMKGIINSHQNADPEIFGFNNLNDAKLLDYQIAKLFEEHGADFANMLDDFGWSLGILPVEDHPHYDTLPVVLGVEETKDPVGDVHHHNDDTNF